MITIVDSLNDINPFDFINGLLSYDTFFVFSCGTYLGKIICKTNGQNGIPSHKRESPITYLIDMATMLDASNIPSKKKHSSTKNKFKPEKLKRGK